MIRRSVAALGAAIGTALVLSACGPPQDQTEEQPHGYVAGAEELAEAQTALAYATRDSRELHLLDLASEQENQVPLTVTARELSEDGRFVYVGDGDRTLEIVDAGVWTVDHTDHVHYYRSQARTLGTVTFETTVRTVAGSGPHTTVGTADGRIRVYDRRQLEEGTVGEPVTIDSRGSTALAVPYAEGLLVAVGDDPAKPANRIVAMDAGGKPTGALETPCAAPSGWAVLRGGVVIACEDSLLRIKHTGTALTAERLDSPGGPVPPADFGHRPRSNEAALAGAGGIWSVNASKVTLKHLPADGRELVAAASPADDRTVLALDNDGTLISYELDTGTVIAQAPLAASTLTLDVSRAYLAVPADRVILEIDYADELRTARTLRTAQQPDLAVEVGR
ncbi:hypothetical protein [Actinoplanes sp. NBRC 101535]|uniref:hypothetical protein n=1 Tax=Actinoplanes sp. NBRC 101535 TaxID=3032196 RepID=UPI0024A16C92|nr:hypothetical protein [Actinoplanes sp. NBRC 101535]GLY07877.1 lipoprotein [Actinoplanes sp. NBRC 101535]